MANWKDIPGDTREKYGLYLCSREWAELREAVRRRANGKCERCDERLEDLQAICTPCHKFTHGKSDEDPAADVFQAMDLVTTMVVRCRVLEMFGGWQSVYAELELSDFRNQTVDISLGTYEMVGLIKFLRKKLAETAHIHGLNLESTNG